MELSKERPAEPVFIPQSTSWIVGVDLGQASDPTAICVLQHSKGVLDPNSEWERHTNTGLEPQRKAERLWVQHLERLPLGLSYPEIVQRVQTILVRPPIDDPSTVLVIDETGVGRAVGDIFVQHGMRPKRVTITAGSEETSANGFDRWSVAKSILITRLDASLHTGRLEFAGALKSGPLAEELKNFRRDVSAAGRATYQARSGHHDDTVLAVSLANWWATRPPPPIPVFGAWNQGLGKPEPKPFPNSQPGAYREAVRTIKQGAKWK
jgi:hypothetical protein